MSWRWYLPRAALAYVCLAVGCQGVVQVVERSDPLRRALILRQGEATAGYLESRIEEHAEASSPIARSCLRAAERSLYRLRDGLESGVRDPDLLHRLVFAPYFGAQKELDCLERFG